MATPQTNRPRGSANPNALVGGQVGRYSVVRHLASGGMAELYIARQEAMGGFESRSCSRCCSRSTPRTRAW